MSRNAAQRRQPVFRHGRRIVGLWQRTTKSGERRFDAQIRRNGRPTFVVLAAVELDAAIADAARVRLDGPAPAPKLTGVTVAELAHALMADMRSSRFRMRSGRPYKPSTIDLYEAVLEHRIVPELGAETPWRQLQRTEIDRLVDELASTQTANTARGSIAVLRTLDRFAARRLGTARLSLELEGVPSSERRREPVLVDETIIAKVPERHRLAAALCLFAGLRASEACALEWRHIEGDILSVEQQLDHVGAAMTTPKSRLSTRQVPIHPLLRIELDAHADRLRASQDELARRRPLEGRLYPYDRHVLRRALKRALDVTPQSLRHSFKEQLRIAGVGEVDSARLAGHSPKVGSTAYASANSAERTREQIAAAFSGKSEIG
jgi:integrase